MDDLNSINNSTEKLKIKTAKSMMWKFLERICAKMVSLIVSIVLARILFPKDYSVISIVFIFIGIADVFINGGLNLSLIQKKDSDVVDYSTILFTNIGIATVFYVCLFFCAPLIANLYENQLLIPVLRVLGILLFINAFKSIICAYVSNNMDFKKFFITTIIGTVISGIVGITLAKLGFGAWALVAQQLTNSFIDTVLLFSTNNLKLRAVFSFSKLKKHLQFGWKLFVSSIISTAYDEAKPLIVGIKFTPTDLAFYNKGNTYPQLINTTINSTMSSVMFPALSKLNKDPKAVLSATRRYIRCSSFIVFPIMVGFALVAHSFVEVVLTSKWLPIVPYLQIFCLCYMFNMIHLGNGVAINVIGRTDITLVAEVVQKVFFTIIIILFIFISPSPIIFALSNVACLVVSLLAKVIPAKRILGYQYRLQILDISKNLVTTLTMCLAVYFVSYINMHKILLLIIQVVVGALVYVGVNVLIKNKDLIYFYDIIKTMIKRKKKTV